MSVDIRSQEGTVVFPPNKPLEVDLEFSKIPVIYDHLFFLDFNKKGESILGASNVAGTFWEGTLLYFKNAKDVEDFNYSGYYIYSTTSDGKFVNDNTIALAEDTAVLSILTTNEGSEPLQPINYFRHSQRIPQIAVWDNTTQVLTCCDKSVAIFDINNLERKPSEKFDNFHLESVNSVDTLKKDPSLFVSASSDRKSCLWDIRNPIPASVLYSNEFSALTSISCNQSNTNYMAVGTQGGDVYLIDSRQPRTFVEVVHCFDSSIYRICFGDSNQFAICADSNEVLVLSYENKRLEEIYKNSEHNGFVRDIKWHGETLYSCGFGKCMVKHVRRQG